MIGERWSVVRRTAAGLTALLGVTGVGACTTATTDRDVDDTGSATSDQLVIESARWRQMQALPDFDSEPGDMTAPAELERLAVIIETHGLRGEDVTLGEVCDGGRATTVDYVTEQGDDFTIRLAGCLGGEAADAIDRLVTEWREER